MRALHRIEPALDRDRLRDFLRASDPDDYLLEELDAWVREGRLWVVTEGEAWVAFGRLHDLGRAEGWVSGLRVRAERRGQGLGGQLLLGLMSDARSLGLRELRAVIESTNAASQRLFARSGFRPVLELTLRCGHPSSSRAVSLRPAQAGERPDGALGWLPATDGISDLMPGSDGGRLGRWDPSLLDRWTMEGKLYLGRGLAAAVQADWWPRPRTMWVHPLQGTPEELVPALGALADRLGQEAWQAFLPSSDALRQTYAALGLTPHPFWGDRIHLYEHRVLR